MSLFNFSVTKILILNGRDYKSERESEQTKSGILSIIHGIPVSICNPLSIWNLFDPIRAKYQPIADHFDNVEGRFAINCDSKVIVGGGRTNYPDCSSKNVFVFENNEFKEIQPLN